MTSFEVVSRGTATAIMITASHNPWTDNGFKVKSPSGAAAGPEILAVLERTIRSTRARHRRAGRSPTPRQPAWSSGSTRSRATAITSARTLDLERLRAADVSVLVEPLYGSGAGWIPRLLEGGRIRIREIHSERNPYFGGINPEPIRPNVDEALGILAAGGYDLGLLLDGDADRAGAADERGTFIHQLQVMGLFMYYLLEHRGMREPVVYTVNETSMVERLGQRYGVPVHETLGRVQVRRPQDDRDRRDDGRRGVRRLRLRHAPPGARRDLRRPDAARPVPPRAGTGPLACLEGGRAPARDRRTVVSTCGRTCTSIA